MASSTPAAWQLVPGGRSLDLTPTDRAKDGFTLMAPAATGVWFTNVLAQERHLTNQVYLNGSGVAAGDVNGDGWCDLYFCGLDGPNALYLNQGGWKFREAAAEAGVGCVELDATAAALADLDGDSDLDLVVNSVGAGTHVFLNDGSGRFRRAAAAPLNPRRHGSTLALADADGDGDLDLYTANYRAVTIRDQPNTKFSIRTVDGRPEVHAIDGRPLTDPDLTNRFHFRTTLTESGGNFSYEENGEPDAFWLNDGRASFQAVPFTGGAFLDEDGRPLAETPLDWGLAAMFRDLDGDGDPDLYVCNDFKSPDRIWLNDGGGRFRAAPRLVFRQTSLSSMGVDFADLDRDGFDEVFVADMLSREHLRRFTQRFEMRPEPLPIGAIENRPQSSRNTLFWNRGDSTWAEVAQAAGIEASEWSWTPVFLDVDLDGWEDLVVSTGFERDNMHVDVLRRLESLKKEKPLSSLEQLRLRRLFPRLATGCVAFRNRGRLRFEETTAAWGLGAPVVAHGLALADLDNDGDADLVVNNMNAPAGLYRNDATAPRLAVRLKGLPPNTRGIGARIRVAGGLPAPAHSLSPVGGEGRGEGAPFMQSQEIISGGRYLSCDDAQRVFAAGNSTNEMTIEVRWRGGQRSVIRGAKAGRLYEIDEAAAVAFTNHSAHNGSFSLSPAVRDGRGGGAPRLFADVSPLLNHSHAEEPFDDFALQPLLTHRQSQLGPGVAWFDVDGDGAEDLIVGAGKGGRPAMFRNDARGGFQRLDEAPFQQPVTRDQTAVLGWRKASGQAVLLAGSANYEDGFKVGAMVRRYDLVRKVVEDALPAQEWSPGPMAMADVDGDGDLDLFVGGRVIAGRFPEAASSMLIRDQDGRLAADLPGSAVFTNLGLSSGVVFSDLDADGDPDLVVACHWGPLRVFRNDRGKFSIWDPNVDRRRESGPGGRGESISPAQSPTCPLSQLSGWWNGITAGDFDGDGRMDLAASNWGRNSRYESFRAAPLRVYYGDTDGNDTVEVLEARFDPAANRVLPMQPFHQVGLALPLLRERLGTFEAYARASFEEIHAGAMPKLRRLEAAWLESTVFLNRGDHFEARPLPWEAQLAPAFAVCVADFDGDGAEDLFLSQNFFAVQMEVSRYDAGRGLVLLGDGKGGFRPLPGQDSGVLVHGEQRGAAVCDYDADGRTDLVVSQNAAATRLFRNTSARPGLRVRLAGPPGNPHGVGAVLRAATGDVPGPAREIHAGAGYWSQDAATQVLCATGAVSRVWTRWPGGKVTESVVAGGAREISIDASGAVQVLR